MPPVEPPKIDQVYEELKAKIEEAAASGTQITQPKLQLDMLKAVTQQLCTDASASTLCADGQTCRATKKACAEAVPYDGCPLGTAECKARKDVCVPADAAGKAISTECAEKIGCADGTTFCGFSRKDGAKVDLDGKYARPKPVCRPSGA